MGEGLGIGVWQASGVQGVQVMGDLGGEGGMHACRRWG